MVNSILKYIEPQLKAYMTFLNRVDSPVFRISSGEMIKGNGQEKEVVTISDLNGNSLYIRQTQPETVNERKALSSCDKEYNISARCKVVFYSFGGNDFTIAPDKVKSKIVNTLSKLNFSYYTGTSTEIKIEVNGSSLDIEKIFTEETGKEFSGNVWPTLVTVDFTLSYIDTNCNVCDIEESENPVLWTPEVNPDNCETKAICEVVAKCDVIVQLQEETASLQEQIDNLPTGGLTCDDLAGCQEIISINENINTLTSDFATHINDFNNPHAVTLEEARGQNSSISGDINANNNTIINLKDAVNPQEPITKIQFDTYVSAVGGNRGAIDCSANPNYPASNKGDRWEITVAGKIGGPSGINVDVYDEIVCVTASASGDQATVGVNFYIVQGNIERATETTNGYTSYATDAEVQAGIENTKAFTSLKLQNWWVNIKTLAQTFAAKITFTTAPRFSSTTAGQYLKVDASKDLTSVANIPATDISTDSTHRFITDVERLKWNKFSYTDTVLGTATSGTGNQFSKSVLIPANTVTNGALNIKGRSVKSGSTSYGWLNIYINTTNNLSGSPKHLGQINNSGLNTLAHFAIDRTIPVQSGSFVTFIVNTTNGFEEIVTNQASTATIDWTIDQYVILSCQCNVGTDTMRANFLSVNQF